MPSQSLCYHLLTSTLHEAPHYAALSSLPSLPLPNALLAALSPNAKPGPRFNFLYSYHFSPLLCEGLDAPIVTIWTQKIPR